MQTYYPMNQKFIVHSKKHKSIKLDKSIIRFIVLFLIMTICFTFGAMMNAYANNNDAAHLVVQRTIDVVQGDTLWEIAQEHAPDRTSVREYIRMIKKANGLHSVSLQEGQILILP